jgi:hypothetical protein
MKINAPAKPVLCCGQESKLANDTCPREDTEPGFNRWGDKHHPCKDFCRDGIFNRYKSKNADYLIKKVFFSPPVGKLKQKNQN